MSLRITHNVEAMNAARNLQANTAKISASMEKLSSGYRINRAADDAAGLGISESMRSQIRGLAQAQRNIQDGVSMVQTAEGNLDEVHSMLQRIRELAVQYKNGSLDDNARTSIQNEVNQLSSEIDRIGSQASFNGIKLLDGTATVSFQVGANDGEQIGIAVGVAGLFAGTDGAGAPAAFVQAEWGRGSLPNGATIGSGSFGPYHDYVALVDTLVDLLLGEAQTAQRVAEHCIAIANDFTATDEQARQDLESTTRDYDTVPLPASIGQTG